MSSMDDGRLEGLLCDRTATYFDELEECVQLLPTLLDQYARDGAYHETAAQIGEHESACDRTNRAISSLISNASVEEIGLRNTRLHLDAGQIIGVYQALDEIANTAEQFAEELVAMAPHRADECLATLNYMAEYAAETLVTLRTAITDYVTALTHPQQSVTLTDGVARIRRAESECDELRRDVIETACSEGISTESLVYRELAHLLDAIVDTMEDVTDQLLHVNGNREWVDIEP